MKKRKILKKIGLSALATFMFCLPVLGAGCTPPAVPPANANQGQSFDLGLNPDTDPTVYTTASGLEIKKANALISNTATFTTNTGYSFTQNLSGFYYFTMGTFSGTYYTAVDLKTTATITNEKVNWIILGRGEMPIPDNTPAGSAIQGDIGKQEIALGNTIYESLNLNTIPINSEIPKGCFLVLSEKCLGQSYFNSTGAGNGVLYTSAPATGYIIRSSGGNFGNRYRYIGNTNATTIGSQTWTISGNPGGSLYNYINNLFSKNVLTGAIQGNNNLGFTQKQADIIVPQQLYTYYSNGTGYAYQETPETDGGTYYSLFPLTRRECYPSIYQNFCFEDYLSLTEQRIASMIGTNQSMYWWLRCSPAPEEDNDAFNLIRTENIRTSGSSDGSQSSYGEGVRPAMVVRLA